MPGATDHLVCDVTINSIPAAKPVTLQLTVDSGSSVSILPKQWYDQHFCTVMLQAPTARLVAYSKEPILVLGCLPSTVSKYGLTCPVHFFIVDNGTALLGMDLIKGLQLRFNGRNVPLPQFASVCALSTPPSQQATLGCVKKFTHKVHISDFVPRVRCKLCRLPFSWMPALLKRKRFFSLGVSDCCGPKENEGICMCVDLRGPNKAVIVHSYPLPHMEEMMTLLQGATFFSTITETAGISQHLLHTRGSSSSRGCHMVWHQLHLRFRK